MQAAPSCRAKEGAWILSSRSVFSLNCLILEHSGKRAGPGSHAAHSPRCRSQQQGGFRRDQPASCGLEEEDGRCFNSSSPLSATRVEL